LLMSFIVKVMGVLHTDLRTYSVEQRLIGAQVLTH
jgi:hypothetical protein